MNNATMPVVEESKEMAQTNEGTPLFQKPTMATLPASEENDASMAEFFLQDEAEENEIPEVTSIKT